MPKLKVDIITTTDHSDDTANNLSRLQGEPMIIKNPGEYESHGIFVYGIPAGGEKSLFVIEAEGIRLGHAGLYPQELTDTQLEIFEGVDILFLPITTDNKKLVSGMVSQVQPRIVIPIMHTSPKVKMKLATLDDFAKELGVKDTTGEKKVIIKQKDLPVEDTQVIILNPA